MSPDRSIAPAYQPIVSVDLPPVRSLILDNGVPLYLVNIGQQEVLRLECLFYPGAWDPARPLAAQFAIRMLTEGTHRKSAAVLHETFDRYGAFVEAVHTPDHLGIVIYCMPRFLPDILPQLTDMLENAAFADKEWDELKNISLQQLRVNLEQNSWVAGSRLKSALFGGNTPYGYAPRETDYEALESPESRRYYEQHIRPVSPLIFLSGKISDETVSLINRWLGQRKDLLPVPTPLPPAEIRGESVSERIEKDGSLQTSIRIGRRLFSRKHPDYFSMLVTNELLGGFFGSRLMKNIREEKGLTYGISSHLPVMRHLGYFMITTDVKKEFAGQTLEEIYKEITRLQTEPVTADELALVKNVMAGEFAGSLGTAFEIADRHRIVLLNQLPPDYYEQYISRVRAVTAESVMFTAQKYLNRESFSEILVG